MRLQRAEVSAPRGSHPASRLPVWQPRARPPQQVGLAQHLQPARLVRDRRARLVVDLRVAVRLAVAQHCERDAQDLVRRRHDRPARAAPDRQPLLVQRSPQVVQTTRTTSRLYAAWREIHDVQPGAVPQVAREPPEPRRDLQTALDVQVARDARKHRSRPQGIRPAQAPDQSSPLPTCVQSKSSHSCRVLSMVQA